MGFEKQFRASYFVTILKKSRIDSKRAGNRTQPGFDPLPRILYAKFYKTISEDYGTPKEAKH